MTPQYLYLGIRSIALNFVFPKAISENPQYSQNASSSTAGNQTRQERVRRGIEELSRWLQDFVKGGFADLPPAETWQRLAARLVDAQASGLAKRVRSLAEISPQETGWHERFLQEIGAIWTLVRAYQRLDKLHPALQAEVKAQIGWTQRKVDLLQKPGVEDLWLVLGRSRDRESTGATTLKVQRTWLWGESQQQFARILDYVHHRQPLPETLRPGTAWQGELVFYDGLYPQRAIVKSRQDTLAQVVDFPGFTDIEAGLSAYADALGENPWCDRLPMAFSAVIPLVSGALVDGSGQTLPLNPAFEPLWQLVALSGGSPIAVMGEWNGGFFLPLSALVHERFIAF